MKKFEYDGSVTRIRDEASKWIYHDVDGLGRLATVTEDPGGLGYVTTYTYDALDNLRLVTQSGQTRTFTYSSLKRLTSAANPENGTTSYTYDNNGNLLTRTDARNVVTTMTYDALNRVTTKSYSDSTPPVTYCYDGKTWTGTYAQCTGSRAAPFLGRLTEEGSWASSTKLTNYDSLGRVTASAQKTGGVTYTFNSYQYKLNDGLSQVTYPSQRVINYQYYDYGGRVKSVSGVQSGNTKNYTDPGTPISYAAHGALAALKLPSQLIEQHCYNARLQATAVRVGAFANTDCANNSDILNIGLTFSTTQNNGNVLNQTIIRGSQTWTQTYTNCYDGVNRLTCASESGSGTWSQTYGYDNYGNRWVPVSGSSGLPSASNEVPNGSNWYLSNNRINGWGYDSAGNVTAIQNMPRTYEYDAENRQTKATVNGVETTYKYDGQGRRVSKTWNGQTTTFVYDAFGNLAAEYDGLIDTSGTQFLTPDHLGSTRLVTNSAGAVVKCYDYLPFGEEIGSGTAGRPTSCFGSGSYPVVGGATNVEFTSKERDAETGLNYFGARYMSSAQGRFTSPDTAGPDLTNPQTLNKYRYALNNPLRYVDPNGLYERDVHHDLTYSLALAAGINSQVANSIANADQGVDDNPATNPTPPWYRADKYLSGGPVLANWHFTDPSRREFLWDEFFQNGSAESLGSFLHTQQDSYSHAGLGPNLGQATTWPWKMKDVDRTFNDPAKADAMAADTFSHLLAAKGRLGGGYAAMDPKIVGGFVKRFNRATTPGDKQKILKELNGLAEANISRQAGGSDAARQCALGNPAACGFGN